MIEVLSTRERNNGAAWWLGFSACAIEIATRLRTRLEEAPLNALLRQGSTYVVFRKLEQQVPEFHAFLLDHRPDDPHAQLKLAAEFVGRWPYGASLVVSPDRPLGLGANPQRVINDFLYAADDPRGQRCPLGAHARRANPRDTGGTDEVRRHRILRRSISYGGPFLPPV